jgi:carotenoid cleavage dioxygenase-like enzyme
VSNESPDARLVRWTFDPAGNTASFTEQLLDDRPGEFPRLDERFAMSQYRHGYFNSAPVTEGVKGGAARGGIAHIDLITGRTAEWLPEIGDYCSEAIFVERHADALEGDGWLLSVIWRGNQNRSDLAVFDAADIAAGPIALAHLSHRVPAGFHGNWRNALG